MIAVSVSAATWSALPDAVSTLQRDPENPAALAVIASAEASILSEARAGHLAATAALMDTYEALVLRLADGDPRVSRLRARLASVLVAAGDAALADDPERAGAAWALAAGLERSPEAVDRLRSALLPPANADPGAVWRSPLDGAELIFVPALLFEVGCVWGDNDCRTGEEGPEVSVPAIWVDRNEVTNEQYGRCVSAGACSSPVASDALGDPDRAEEPVVGVTWKQAAAFAVWSGRRLPSEAEWQRAGRDDEREGRFPWGKGRGQALANVYETSDSDPFPELAPVGSFPATGWGLADVAGNVWEWCADRYHRNLSGMPRDGRAWLAGGWGRSLRGGSWRRTLDVARLASRTWQDEHYAADDVGFRCVVDPPEKIPAERLVQLAARAFPITSEAGAELALADLSGSDRRYLERRNLTWLVVEGRVAEALPQVVAMLRQNPSDQTLQDLLAQLEDEISAGVRRGDHQTVRAAIAGYRSAVAGDRRLTARLTEFERRLIEEVRTSGRSFAGRGEFQLAAMTVDLARLLGPSDPTIDQLERMTEPAAGMRRVSGRDGKLMVWVPAGTFRMGASPGDGAAAYDEHPAHTVSVEGFWLDATEVTNSEYRRCVDDQVCTPPSRTADFDDPGSADHPVLGVTWFQAATYARWAGRRLPTEAEWERAARGGSPTRYPWGDEWQVGLANSIETGGRDRWGDSSPVGSFPPTAWGLLDLLGNASEWVADVSHRNYWDAPSDGRAWNQLNGEWVERQRVIRGGSFTSTPSRLRVSFREQRSPYGSSRATGFRCADDK